MKNVRRYNRMIRRSVIMALRIDFVARRLKKSNLSFGEKYKKTRFFLEEYHRRFKVNVSSFGLDNIPSDLKGCLFIGNHQGKDDCQIVLHALKDIPTSFVVNDARSRGFLLGPVCDAMESIRIKFDDLESQAKAYNHMAEKINEGMRYILFPEAGYNDNKNNIQKFNSACFGPAVKTRCVIIPFCLYDSWKVYGSDESSVDVEVHFLEPITDTSGLNKKKLCELLEEKITNKMNLIKEEKGLS